jgi:hypothetical protein
LSTRKRGFFSKKEVSGDGQGFGTFKYSGAKLKEKGVLISIDGISPTQYVARCVSALLTFGVRLKAVSIEISSKEAGVFHVEATFLGVKVQGEDVQFQDLLQMQYEGTGRMKMFDQCWVNVNLLVFLINKKFFHNK